MSREGIISIIVPIHNTEKYLEQCVRSIMDQTYPNLEIILIDDNSTDHCGEMCDAFAKEDSRVKVIHTKAGSAGAARNAGLDIATGEYIGFVDSDDWIEPDMYEKMLATMRDSGAQCAMCRTRFHHPDGKLFESFFPAEKEKMLPLDMLIMNSVSIHEEGTIDYGIVCVWDKIYRYELWDNLRFDTSLRNAEDRDIFFELALKVDYVVLSDFIGYNYRRFIGISKDGKTNSECNYIVGYRMFYWARENKIEHPFYLDTVVMHSLGRVRASAAYHDRSKFFDTHRDFKRNWNVLKKTLPGSKPIILALSYALRFTPHLLWAGLSVVCRFKKI